MKTVEFELNGRTHHLLLTGAALFDAYDKYGDKGDLMDRVSGTSRESYDDTVWMLVKLSQQGEAWRRYSGEDATPMLTVEEALRTMRPVDVIRARAAIRAAYAIGFDREEPDEEREIDLGLLELQKKNGTGLTRSKWLSITTQFLGLSVRAAQLLTPGLVMDLMDREISRRNLRQED